MSKKDDIYKTSRIPSNADSFEWFCDNPIINWHTGIILVKNLNHEFIASNQVFADYSGYIPTSLVGLNDENMPWSKNKDIYINHEKDIISGLEYNVIEPLNGVIRACLLTNKKIIYSQKGLPSGTIATAIIIKRSIEFGNLSGIATNMKVSDYSGYNLTSCESKVLFFY